MVYTIINKFTKKLFKIELPLAIPQFLRKKKMEEITKIFSGINRWSPMFGKNLFKLIL